jgi:hypothetical protein
MKPEACERTMALAPEMALGIAEGHERAEAVGHLAGCAACRHDLDELAGVADRLLLAVPAIDPPAGFERATLRRMVLPLGRPVAPAGRRRRRRGWRPARFAAAAAAVALAFGAGLLAGRNRLVAPVAPAADPAAAPGSQPRAGVLTDRTGRIAGSVTALPGPSPRILVTLAPDLTDGRYVVQCDDEDGDSYTAGAIDIGGPAPAVWGAALSQPGEGIRRVRLLGADAALDLTARLEPA